MAAKNVQIKSASVTAETPFGFIKIAWPRVDPKNKQSARVVKVLVLPAGQDELRLVSETLADWQKKAEALQPLLQLPLDPNNPMPGTEGYGDATIPVKNSTIQAVAMFLMLVRQSKVGPAAK